MPTYNRAHLLGRAVKSVLAQTFQDYELIVVDDASTDTTEELVHSFHDPRIVYLRHECNRGASAARNTGIRAARGEYVAFQDSDDEWLPEKLARQLEVFRTTSLPSVGIVTCPVYSVHDEGRKIMERSPRPLAQGWVYKVLLTRVGAGLRVPFSTQCLLVRREALGEDNLFDETLSRAEDWDFVLRLSRRWQIVSVQQPLVIYHVHSGFRLTTQRNQVETAEQIISKHYDELAAEPAILARSYYRLAWLSCRDGQRGKCRRNVARVLGLRRWHLKALILYGLTLGPDHRLFKPLYRVVSRTRHRLRWLKYRLGRG